MVRHRRPFVLLGIVAAVLTACTTGGDTPPASLAPAANATTAPGLPVTTDALPVTDVAGFQALMDALVGTPVVVNLWASWCEPCTREIPKLDAAARAHPDIQFLGVDVKDSRDGAAAFIAAHAMAYPSLFDPDGALLTANDALGPPVTLFVAADGTVETTVPGELSQAALDAALASIAPA